MSQRIKIVEITEATTAGVRRHVFDLVMGLNRNRFDITLIAPTLRDPGFENDIRAMQNVGIIVHVVQMRRGIRPVSDLLALVRIVRLLRHSKPHIVHTHSSKGGFLGRMAAHIAGVKSIVHTPHVFPFEMPVSRVTRLLYFKLEQLVAKWTQRYVCVSRWELEKATASSLSDFSKFITIRNGVETGIAASSAPDRASLRAELGCTEADILVGFVGRLTRQKGLEYLIDAAKDVCAGFPAAKFVIVGTGELEGALRERVRRLGTENRFIFTGPREDARLLYHAFDILVLPSLWESLPYSLLEGMCAGCPVVATSVGGIEEVLRNGENGLVVPPRNSQAIAQALSRLIQNPAERELFGSNAKKLGCSRYRLSDMIESTAELYESLTKPEIDESVSVQKHERTSCP